MSLRIAQEFHVERTAQEAKWGGTNDPQWSYCNTSFTKPN